MFQYIVKTRLYRLSSVDAHFVILLSIHGEIIQQIFAVLLMHRNVWTDVQAAVNDVWTDVQAAVNDAWTDVQAAVNAFGHVVAKALTNN